MRTPQAWAWVALTSTVLACGGCGFKGPLYLPERSATVVTHPPQAQPSPGAASAAQPQTPSDKDKGKSSPPSGTPPLGSPPAAVPQSSPPPPH